MATITQCARDLTATKGLDGFTMDDLAERAGVSRRTLFNYVPGKLDAVLGVPPQKDPAILAEFVAGGPTGDLIQDIKAIALASLQSQAPDVEEFRQFRDLVRCEPRLHAVIHERFVEAGDFVSEAIAARQGHADPAVTRIILVLMVGLLDLALDESLDAPDLEFHEHFSRVFDIATALFTGNPAP